MRGGNTCSACDPCISTVYMCAGCRGVCCSRCLAWTVALANCTTAMTALNKSPPPKAQHPPHRLAANNTATDATSAPLPPLPPIPSPPPPPLHSSCPRMRSPSVITTTCTSCAGQSLSLCATWPLSAPLHPNPHHHQAHPVPGALPPFHLPPSPAPNPQETPKNPKHTHPDPRCAPHQ
jgi:hypothetical protein